MLLNKVTIVVCGLALSLVSSGPVYLNDEIKFEAVGCFKDQKQDRALPILVANFRNDIDDWHDLTNVVNLCASAVSEKGYNLFAIQYYGECWSGPNVETTYDKYGPSSDCITSKVAVGKEYTNYVYEIK